MLTTTPTITHHKVTSLFPVEGGTRVVVDGGTTIDVPAQADYKAAARLSAAVRRVDGVELTVTTGRVGCALHLTGWRRQTRQRVPLRIGLALIAGGVTGSLSVAGELD